MGKKGGGGTHRVVGVSGGGGLKEVVGLTYQSPERVRRHVTCHVISPHLV